MPPARRCPGRRRPAVSSATGGPRSRLCAATEGVPNRLSERDRAIRAGVRPKASSCLVADGSPIGLGHGKPSGPLPGGHAEGEPLFDAAEELLRLGHKERGRERRIEERQEALQAELDLPQADFQKLAKRFAESYWIAEPIDIITQNARHMLSAGDASLSIDATVYPDRGATLVQVYASDHPGLFYRIAGAIHLAGGNIIDARIHTTSEGGCEPDTRRLELVKPNKRLMC